MKRYIAMVLSLLLLAAMTACGDFPRAATAGSETGAPTQSPSEPILPETQPPEMQPSETLGEDAAEVPVRVQWGELIVPQLHDYIEFVADVEYAAPVLITTERTVTDFELVYLTIREVYEDGTVSYDADPVYSLESLTPERPLVAYLSFPGDFSTYGISFVDTDGTTHRLTVQVSGKDGSLLVQETD